MARKSSPLSLRFTDWLKRCALESAAQTKGQRTVADIKLSAALLMERRSIDDFSLEDVASGAGISRPAIYQYFSSKQVLLLSLLEDFQIFTGSTLQNAKHLPGNANPRDVNRAYVHFFAANARLMVAIEKIEQSLKGASKMQFAMNERWAHKIAKKMVAVDGTASIESQQSALLRAFALEHMVDGLLSDIYVRKNPALKQFASNPDLVADALSDIWERAIDNITRR